jgi:hypothetical protein
MELMFNLMSQLINILNYCTQNFHSTQFTKCKYKLAASRALVTTSSPTQTQVRMKPPNKEGGWLSNRSVLRLPKVEGDLLATAA